MKEHQAVSTRQEDVQRLPAEAQATLEAQPGAPQALLTLQRTAGNRAVSRLLRAGAGPTPAPATSGLRVGPAGDASEREADSVAQEVMESSSEPVVQRAAGAPGQDDDCPGCGDRRPVIRRQAGTEGARMVAPPAVHAALRQPGRPLDPGTRRLMERRLGHDLGGVRLHTTGLAADSARAVDARAYTVGRDIVFGDGQYAPHTRSGQRLLAHELAHVVQHSPVLRRDPVDPARANKPPRQVDSFPAPKSAAIKTLIKDYERFGFKVSITLYFVVQGKVLTVYDQAGKLKVRFVVDRPGLVDVVGYFLGNPFKGGWSWIAEDQDGEYMPVGKTAKAETEIQKGADTGWWVAAVDEELIVEDWIQERDQNKFRELATGAQIAMVVMDFPRGGGGGGKQGPILTHELPDWFKELRRRVTAQIDSEKKNNKGNPYLPDKIFFYGSDMVQAQKGVDAWTIEVEKAKREAYLTILKKAWDEAPDKEAFAHDTTAILYKKVKLMVDEAELREQEHKEITAIDSSGEKKKGSPWGWAVTLRKQIEALLSAQRLKEPAATNYPDKLTLSRVGEGATAQIHLRVVVYKAKEGAKPTDLPEMVGGTLPTPLTRGDTADTWVPVVRKLAGALRIGAVTTDPAKAMDEEKEPRKPREKSPEEPDPEAPKGDPDLLPAYPAKIYAPDLSPDGTTAVEADNLFRMAVDTAAIHGSNTVHLTTIHMQMDLFYSWKVFRLPNELAELRTNREVSHEILVQEADRYVRRNWATLGTPKDTYSPDRDLEQTVDMSALGTGDFLLVGLAKARYPDDWGWNRATSLATFPFSVSTVAQLARESAYAEANAIQDLKNKLLFAEGQEADKLRDQIKDMEARDKQDLQGRVGQDIAETKKILKAAERLKIYIAEQAAAGIPYQGDATHDPFLFRVKALDQEMYVVYVLMRQIFPTSYGDKRAVEEYVRVLQEQVKELEKLSARVSSFAGYHELLPGWPVYRVAATLVRKEDGNQVPLTLMVGWHQDSTIKGEKPDGSGQAAAGNEYKMIIFDVTFESKKQDMIYVGDSSSSKKAAADSAFEEFGKENKYGKGTIVFRIPQLEIEGWAYSTTSWYTYLQYALAAIGIALLIVGTVVSGGLLAPATAAAIGGVVTVLGVATAVAGAALAARNIYKRAEKGTFELDAEFALDMVSIIGAYAQAVGTVGRMARIARGAGALAKAATVQRLDRLIQIYDLTELVGTGVLVSLKVQEDVEAIDKLNLSDTEKEEMRQQIALEAVQTGAMMAYTAFGKIKDAGGYLKSRVEASRYRTFKTRGWLDAQGNPTDQAPPMFQNRQVKPGQAPSKHQQGHTAWAEARVMPLGKHASAEAGHEITITERGRIIRCSDFCTDLRVKYEGVIKKDPALAEEMTRLESKAQAAADAGDKKAGDAVAREASAFEARLQEADALRRHLFGATNKEWDDLLETIESPPVKGGAKSGYHVEGVTVPGPRRALDGSDLMTEAELKMGKGGYTKAVERIHKVMGRKISDIPELKAHWEDVKQKLMGGKTAEQLGRDEMIKLYKSAQRAFWKRVRQDPKAVAFLKQHGFEFQGKSGAPLAELGPQGKKPDPDRGSITNQERRISLDHIQEKAQAENWKKALDGDNLELMFQNANSWKEIVQVKFKLR